MDPVAQDRVSFARRDATAVRLGDGSAGDENGHAPMHTRHLLN